jgi:hypothetical protein
VLDVIQFGEWMPDLPDFMNPGVVNAKNVIPSSSSYRPFPGLAVQSDALTNYARGAISAKATDNSTFFYCGDETKLYQVRNNTVSAKGTGFSTAVTDGWEFVQFGQTIIATNYADDVQSITIGAGGNFGTLITSTNVPKAKHADVVREFLVLGNTNDSTDGVKPNRVWWSAINDPTDFDPDQVTQSDYQDIPEGGQVQRIVGGAEYGLVFLERQIQRMTYVGSPLVFDFSPVDRRRGTNVPNSVIGHGRNVFYLSEEGFFAFDGAVSHPIGHNRVDRWLLDQFDPANAARVSAAIDPENALVCWGFPVTGSGNANIVLVYNWKDNRWAYAEVETELLVHAETQGFSLDDLDSITTDIDDGSLSPFDSDEYKGGEYRFAAFNNASRLSYFTGDSLAAEIDTGERQFSPGRLSLVRSARPIVDGVSPVVTVAVAGRNSQQEAESFGAAGPVEADGNVSLRNQARYQRFRTTIGANSDWTHAQGLEIDFNPSGAR